MAIANITIDPTKRLGSELRQAVSLLTSARQQLGKIKDIMEQHVAAPTYTELQTQFGLSTAANAEATYNLTLAAMAHLDHADVTQFLHRLG